MRVTVAVIKKIWEKMKGPSKYTLTDWADALIESRPENWNSFKGWDRLNFLATEPDAIAVVRDCRFERLEPNLNLLEWACANQLPIEQLRFLVKVCGIKPSALALTYIFDECESLLKNKPYLRAYMLVQNGARFDRARPFVAYAFAMYCEGTEKFNLLLLQHEHLWPEIMNQYERNYSSKTRFISQMQRMQNAIEILEDRVDNARLAAIAILNLRRRRWRPELRDVWILVAREIIFPQTNLLDSRWSTRPKRQWVTSKIPGLVWAGWMTFGLVATFVVLSLK